MIYEKYLLTIIRDTCNLDVQDFLLVERPGMLLNLRYFSIHDIPSNCTFCEVIQCLTLLQVSPRLQELQLFRLQQESKNLVPATNERENSSKKNAREKRKLTSHPAEEQAPAKHHKHMAQNSNKKIEDDKGQARQSAEPSEAAELDNKIAEHASNPEIQDKSSKKPVQFNDQCTAFVSNLSLQACGLLL